MRVLMAALTLVLAASAARAETLASVAGPVTVTRMVGGLNEPWAIGLLPDGGFLVTERGGRLLHVRDGAVQQVANVPRVRARGQGGLLDITVARDFASTRTLFLTYSHPRDGGASTALASARLSADGSALTDMRRLFLAEPASNSGRHFGSRVVESADGHLFVTLGDRGDGPTAQDRALHNGSVIRLNRDGSVPADNPFAGQAGMRPEIWSYGHRNPQGAGLDLAGNLLTSEHGAKGGDEVNRIRKGANFGWPVITYGVDYSGARIGEGVAKPGMEQPLFYWDPSIAPSGLLVYSGKLWPQWRGAILVGSLKFDHIARLEGNPLRLAETLAGRETRRVRDMAEAPDGAIWFVSVGQGAVYRMTPGG